MTYFLEDSEPPRVASGLKGGLSNGWDRFGAVWNSSSLAGGYRNFEDSQARTSLRNRTYDEAIKRLGGIERVTERMMQGTEPFAPTRTQLDEAVRRFTEEARQSDPDAWADIDLSEETFDRLALEKLNADMREYQDIIAMSPSAPVADFVAGLGSGTANIKTLPFLLAGGGSGSLLGVMGREAAINAGVELALMGDAMRASDDLGLERVDPIERVRDAALYGALFGGGMYAAGRALPVVTDALARGLYAARLRNSTRIEGLPPVEADVATQRVEAALVEDKPLAEVQQIFEELVPREPDPPRGLPPLILRPEERVPDVGNPISRPTDAPPPTPFGAEPVTTELLPALEAQRARPADTPTLTGIVDSALREAEQAERQATQALTRGRRYPLLYALKQRGVRIDPASPEAQELRALGVTNRTMPGLFARPKPDQELPPGLDNQVASELEDSFPGIWDATGTSREQTFLDRQGLFDIIKREADGDQSWQAAFEDVRIARENREALERRGDPTDDFLSRKPPDIEDGLFINRDAYEFASTPREADAQIRSHVEGYLRERGYWDNLLPQEREEIVFQAQRNGGSVDYLVERAWERELDAIEATPPREEIAYELPPGWENEAPAARQDGTTGTPGAGAASAARPVGEQARGGAAGAGGGAGDAFPVQRTAIGDQFLVPGTEVVQTGQAQRDRATIAALQQQSRMRRGNQTRVEDDPGSLFGEQPRDLFAEPTGREARVVQDAITDDLRTTIEADPLADIQVDMGDGRGVRPVSAVLDDLDSGDRASARMDLCGSAPGGDA